MAKQNYRVRNKYGDLVRRGSAEGSGVMRFTKNEAKSYVRQLQGSRIERKRKVKRVIHQSSAWFRI